MNYSVVVTMLRENGFKEPRVGQLWVRSDGIVAKLYYHVRSDAYTVVVEEL